MPRAEDQNRERPFFHGDKALQVLGSCIGSPFLQVNDNAGAFEIRKREAVDFLPLFPEIVRPLDMRSGLRAKREVVNEFTVLPIDAIVRSIQLQAGISRENEILGPLGYIDETMPREGDQAHLSLL